MKNIFKTKSQYLQTNAYIAAGYHSRKVESRMSIVWSMDDY